MAQKAGYQGIKKLTSPLDITTEGTLFIEENYYQKTELSEPIEGQSTVEGALGALSSNKVGWDVAGKSVKKNIFNLKEAKISVSNYTTLANTETGVELSNTGSYTYRGASFVFEGNDYWKNKTLTISSEVTVTSGAGRIGIGYSDDGSTYTDIFNDNVSSGKYEKTFSAGNHKYYRLILQCTLGTAAAGDVVYNELMIRDSRITDSTYAPPIYDNTELLSYADNGVLGAKNQLKYPYKNTTLTLNNVTFTDMGDGTVKVQTTNAGASASTSFTLALYTADEARSLDGMILNGCPSGGSDSSYKIILQKNSSPWSQYAKDTGNGATINSSSAEASILLINVPSGSIITTPIIFKPMIRLATDTDSTFQPYAQTNRQLTVNKAEISAISDDNESGRTTAKRLYAAGEYFYMDGYNCKTKEQVAAGTGWVLDGNYEHVSIDSALKDALSIIDNSASVQSGITNVTINSNANLVKKCGRYVEFRIRIDVTAAISSDTMIIALPYKPLYAHNMLISNQSSPFELLTDRGCYFDSNGKIHVVNLGIGNYFLQGTFLTND